MNTRSYDDKKQHAKDRTEAMLLVTRLQCDAWFAAGLKKFKGQAQLTRIINYLCETIWGITGDNMELTVTAINNETPSEHMTRLGSLYLALGTGRLNAYRTGQMATHDAICVLQDETRAEQKRLLGLHPELMLMAFAK